MSYDASLLDSKRNWWGETSKNRLEGQRLCIASLFFFWLLTWSIFWTSSLCQSPVQWLHLKVTDLPNRSPHRQPPFVGGERQFCATLRTGHNSHILRGVKPVRGVTALHSEDQTETPTHRERCRCRCRHPGSISSAKGSQSQSQTLQLKMKFKSKTLQIINAH